MLKSHLRYRRRRTRRPGATTGDWTPTHPLLNQRLSRGPDNSLISMLYKLNRFNNLALVVGLLLRSRLLHTLLQILCLVALTCCNLRTCEHFNYCDLSRNHLPLSQSRQVASGIRLKSQFTARLWLFISRIFNNLQNFLDFSQFRTLFLKKFWHRTCRASHLSQLCRLNLRIISI